jgi:membrane protein
MIDWAKPFRELGKISYRTWHQVWDADVDLLAASLAFATAVSLVPLLAVSLSVFTAYGGLESLMAKIEPFILQNLVEASGAQLSKSIRNSIGRVHSGALGLGGVVGLLFISTKLFHDMERAIQRVWRIKSERSIFTKLTAYWLVMFLAPIAVAGMLGLMGSKDLAWMFTALTKSAFPFLLAFLTLVTVYKYVPATPVNWTPAACSAFLTSIAFGVAQTSYAAITKSVLRQNKIYGSLASVPIFLLWLLVLWWIFLIGVALTAVLQERRRA